MGFMRHFVKEWFVNNSKGQAFVVHKVGNGGRQLFSILVKQRMYQHLAVLAMFLQCQGIVCLIHLFFLTCNLNGIGSL
jgi:hypothetical protein